MKEWCNVTDPDTHLTRPQEVIVLENAPCRLSFETIKPATETDTVATLAQGVKLFLAPESVINPGSKVIVMQAGRTTEYTASGQPAVYDTHQEVILSLDNKYT